MFSWLVLLRDGDHLVRTHLLRVARDDEVARPQPRRDNDPVCFVARDRDRPRRDRAAWRGRRSTHLAAPPLMLVNLEEA